MLSCAVPWGKKMQEYIDDMVDALKKAPEITHAIVTDQIMFHKEKFLQLLDAVPMATFEHHMTLLRQLVLKIEELQAKIDALEKR